MTDWNRIPIAVSVGFGAGFAGSIVLGLNHMTIMSVVFQLVGTEWALELRAVYAALPGLVGGYLTGHFARKYEVTLALVTGVLGSLPHGLALERIQDGDWAYFFIPYQLIPFVVTFSLGGLLARRHRLRREAQADQAIIDAF